MSRYRVVKRLLVIDRYFFKNAEIVFVVQRRWLCFWLDVNIERAMEQAVQHAEAGARGEEVVWP